VAGAGVSAPEVAGTGHLPRFAQLTYASADRAGYARGWQVQDTAGGLTPAEREFLTRGIATRFTPAASVPAYLAADEARALPRRLVYAPAPGGAAAYWHTAPCGSDAQGRPGNVFVHVVLDRAGRRAGPSPVRPSDLCGSPHWLRPFGPDEVAATTLDAVPELPWEPAPGRADVLAFLFRTPPPDVRVLCLLLDAVYHAMAGGPQVVFGVHTEEAAALWIAAVGHMMSPGTARRFHWSTSERLAERHSWPAGLHLVVVPHEEVAGSGPVDRLVLLGEDEQVRRTDLGRCPRVTRNGSSVEVTAWSEMAYEVSALRELAETVLSKLDRVVAEVGDADLDPAWPMAMVVATMPHKLPDAVTAALSVLETWTPQSLSTDHPGLYEHVLALARRVVGPSTQDAWEALRKASTGAGNAVLRDLYLLSALDDEDWLARPGAAGIGSPVLAGEPPVGTKVRERAEELLRSLHRRTRDGGRGFERVTAAAVVARFTDIVRICRVCSAQRGDKPTLLDELWDWVTDEVVLVPELRESLLALLDGHAGPGAQDALAKALTQRLRADHRRAGTRVPVTVLGLLETRLPRPDELVRSGAPTPLQRELAACLTLVDPDPWSLAWLVRVWDLLGSGDSGGELARLLRFDETARPGHLAILLRHQRPAPVHDLVRRTLLQAHPDADVDDLVAAVLRPGPAGVHPAGLRAVAELRRIVDPNADAPAGRGRLLSLVPEVVAEVTLATLTRSLWWSMVLAAYTAEMLCRSWNDAPETTDEYLPPPVAQALRAQAADPDGNKWSARTLALYQDVPHAALVHAGLCLRWPADDVPPGWSRLRRLEAVIVANPDAWSVVDRAVSLRYWAGQLDEGAWDEGFRRFRQELRGPERSRARRLLASRGEDTDGACRAWWVEVTTTDPDAATSTYSAPWWGGH